jgi:hypothetical protein
MTTPRVRKSTPAELAVPDELDTDTPDDVAPEELFVLDLRAEVQEEAKTFELRINDEESVMMPLPNYWPVGAVDRFQHNDLRGGLEMIGLDEGEVELMLLLPNSAYKKIMDYAEQISGVNQGEGRRSATSSRSTGTKSKRTSSRNTKSTSAITSRRTSARAS